MHLPLKPKLEMWEMSCVSSGLCRHVMQGMANAVVTEDSPTFKEMCGYTIPPAAAAASVRETPSSLDGDWDWSISAVPRDRK